VKKEKITPREYFIVHYQDGCSREVNANSRSADDVKAAFPMCKRVSKMYTETIEDIEYARRKKEVQSRSSVFRPF
tara:strand:+ start:272 stop:496 length:225 start_codon:yes stop_codon:yes gene_type:complete